jgi:hypothetical protein
LWFESVLFRNNSRNHLFFLSDVHQMTAGWTEVGLQTIYPIVPGNVVNLFMIFFDQKLIFYFRVRSWDHWNCYSLRKRCQTFENWFVKHVF